MTPRPPSAHWQAVHGQAAPQQQAANPQPRPMAQPQQAPQQYQRVSPGMYQGANGQVVRSQMNPGQPMPQAQPMPRMGMQGPMPGFGQQGQPGQAIQQGNGNLGNVSTLPLQIQSPQAQQWQQWMQQQQQQWMQQNPGWQNQPINENPQFGNFTGQPGSQPAPGYGQNPYAQFGAPNAGAMRPQYQQYQQAQNAANQAYQPQGIAQGLASIPPNANVKGL